MLKILFSSSVTNEMMNKADFVILALKPDKRKMFTNYIHKNF